MANLDRADGFSIGVRGFPYYPPTLWPLAASQTLAPKDMVLIDSAGRISIGLYNSGAVAGTAGIPCASSSAGDDMYVFDNPDQVFEGQCSGNGALANAYTCATAASCFDIEGTTGIMEINEDLSTYDIVKVIGDGYDPVTGKLSAVGANQRKLFRINEGKHQLGVHS